MVRAEELQRLPMPAPGVRLSIHALTSNLLGPNSRIRAEDHCHFLVAFSRGTKSDGDIWNQRVRALKLSPENANADAAARKREAIEAFATELSEALPAEWRRSATFVPTPSSRSPKDPAYDPRVFKVLKGVSPPLDVQCLVEQIRSRQATHLAEKPCTLDELVCDYRVVLHGVRLLQHIVVVDDILATGLHYRAMCAVLGQAAPSVPISGLFLARRAHELDG
jgi:hypothetical protein